MQLLIRYVIGYSGKDGEKYGCMDCHVYENPASGELHSRFNFCSNNYICSFVPGESTSCIFY